MVRDMRAEPVFFKADKIPAITGWRKGHLHVMGAHAQIRVIERHEKGQSRQQIAAITGHSLAAIDDVLAVFAARHAAAGWGARK